MRILFAIVLFSLSAVMAAEDKAADQKQFLGRWRMNVEKSRAAHRDDVVGDRLWRSYERDGDRVRAAWGDETGETGSYWAKCTGRPEKVLEGMSIRCWQGASMVIEGEQLGKGDGKHKYSRREVSADGSTMTLTWFEDEKRTVVSDRFVFERVK
ncbi:MAG: hypothetical protein SGI92_22960 [Bryobacteraceae bacterium]|nr:hypothetical protein [Bryobacteraceae bacterium]